MNRRSRILMVLDHAFPPDIRVENEARTLVEAGFDVTILAIGEDERPPMEDLGGDMQGVRVIRNRMPNRIRNMLRGLAGTIPLIEGVLGREIKRIYSDWQFDALHAHDLYLFGVCLRVGNVFNVRVVGDMHENWVHALSQYHWSTHYPKKGLISLKRWDRLETEWCNRVDGLILVIDEMKDRIRKKGIDHENMIVVPNTIRRTLFDVNIMGGDIVGRAEEREEACTAIRLIYTGGMDLHRGLDTVLTAMPQIRAALPGASLTLVGDGSVRADLERLSARLGVADCVTFSGWQAQEKIPDYIRSADIGLIPHLKSVHTDNVIPHKLFHYMYLGLPVIATDCTPLKRIVEQERAGVIYPSGDAAGLTAAVIKIAGDRDKRITMGENGVRAVSQRYNWEATSKSLVTMYNRLLE